MLLGVYSTQEVPDVQINKQIIDWSLAECVVTSAGIVSPAQLACTGTWFTDKTPCAMYLGPDPSSN